jgi:hypothetical protein
MKLNDITDIVPILLDLNIQYVFLDCNTIAIRLNEVDDIICTIEQIEDGGNYHIVVVLARDEDDYYQWVPYSSEEVVMLLEYFVQIKEFPTYEELKEKFADCFGVLSIDAEHP